MALPAPETSALPTGSLAGRIATHVALLALAALFLAPFAWMVSSSFKGETEIFVFPPRWIPETLRTENYPESLAFFPFVRYLLNTLLVCVGCMAGNVLSASLVAYSVGVLRWRGRKWLFRALLASMLLPPQVTMIPVFILFRHAGLVDTLAPLILPAFLGTPFFIFLLRQFFLAIPRELLESASLDGCNEWGAWWRIILPLSVPALSTVLLFSFLWAWTDFMTPLIYLQDPSNFTLSLGLQQFQESHTTHWGMLLAASVLMTVPLIVLFFATQKTFVQGIVTTGLKG